MVSLGSILNRSEGSQGSIQQYLITGCGDLIKACVLDKLVIAIISSDIVCRSIF